MTGWLRLRAELIKAGGRPVHVAYGVGLALTALMIVTNMGEEAAVEGRPTPASLARTPAGALLAVSQQLGTLAGVLLTAVFVAASTARELEDGTATHSLLFDPRRVPLAIRKLVISWIHCGPGALLAVSAMLWVLANLNSLRLDDVEGLGTVPWSQALAAAGACLFIQLHFVTMAVAVALWTRSLAATALITGGPYLVMMPVSAVDSIDPWLPHHWQSALLNLQVEQRFIWYVWPSDGGYITPTTAVVSLLTAAGIAVAAAVLAVRRENILHGGS